MKTMRIVAAASFGLFALAACSNNSEGNPAGQSIEQEDGGMHKRGMGGANDNRGEFNNSDTTGTQVNYDDSM